MTEFFNRRQEKGKRRVLRREMPLAEALVWARLRDRQVGGWKFRRQHSVGVYILDFYCPACQIAVELDGGSHDSAEAQEYDAVRTAYLGTLGIRVIRFSNAAVSERIEEVIAAIEREAEDTSPGSSPRNPLLRKGEGESAEN